MNNDTTILLLIAEQHSAILSLRRESAALQQRIQELEADARATSSTADEADKDIAEADSSKNNQASKTSH